MQKGRSPGLRKTRKHIGLTGENKLDKNIKIILELI